MATPEAIRPRQAQDPTRPLQLLFGSKPPKARTAFELHELIEKGFPSETVIALVQSVGLLKDRQVFAKVIGMSERTFQRRIKHPEPLSAEQSSRAWCFAEVLSKAEEVLGDRQEAAKWMVTPAMGLEGRAPIDLLTTQVGFELVEDFLTRMQYGVYS
ncbi:putative toxin-antitoxin system antitoxin component, TIGR02293 family [Azotobacter beijerinckii]|uniref:Putative toxin-antitoxin system antitoxin component, TIGR02293 family n=1 Tax=Azotobacter beijerinckii TaxID=170623 RepID=A0A1H6YQE1_9GAMM|nr:antitoxin Xre/MbcA/ParS toxin-binding domain-containing protein [Azotobacter beijerinckii]SEJ43491.1 putative toxin-antitoxin system antitoxin component, TIGR02293 family [Azotobacter beijerinckii]